MQMVARISAGSWWFPSMVLGGVCAAAVLSGCSASHAQARRAPTPQSTKAAPSTQPAAANLSAPSTQPAPSTAVDPMGMMREALVRCEELQGYEIVFHRQERRGLLGKLADWEDIQVHYRKQPRSIKMAWLNADSEYAEAIYVEGANDGRVTVLPRKGLFGLPASPVSVPPEMAVTMGKSLRPIHDFGLAAMVQRTLSRIEEAGPAGGATVTYEGQMTVERLGTRAHHVAVCYPKGFGQAVRQDLYINVETGYPDGSYIWLANGDLMAAYLYEKPVVVIPADEMFALVKTRTPAKKE